MRCRDCVTHVLIRRRMSFFGAAQPAIPGTNVTVNQVG